MDKPKPDPELPEDFELDEVKVALYERCTSQYFSYTLDCYDKVKSDGTDILKWLFWIVAGGMGMAGPVAMANHWWLAVALASVIVRASFAASTLIAELRAQDTKPPGNYARALNKMVDDTGLRMRWREAWSVDERIDFNTAAVERVAAAVGNARKAVSTLPLIFVPVATVAAVCQFVRP